MGTRLTCSLHWYPHLQWTPQLSGRSHHWIHSALIAPEPNLDLYHHWNHHCDLQDRMQELSLWLIGRKAWYYHIDLQVKAKWDQRTCMDLIYHIYTRVYISHWWCIVTSLWVVVEITYTPGGFSVLLANSSLPPSWGTGVSLTELWAEDSEPGERGVGYLWENSTRREPGKYGKSEMASFFIQWLHVYTH